jgi:hypothetical protein
VSCSARRWFVWGHTSREVLLSSRFDLAQEFLERTIGNHHHLRVGTVLNRMRDEDRRWIGAERLGLMLGTVDELDRGHVHARNAA